MNNVQSKLCTGEGAEPAEGQEGAGKSVSTPVMGPYMSVALAPGSMRNLSNLVSTECSELYTQTPYSTT